MTKNIYYFHTVEKWPKDVRENYLVIPFVVLESFMSARFHDFGEQLLHHRSIVHRFGTP